MTIASIPITITEWNICDCPAKSRTYGAKTHEALMTWMRSTMTLVFLWISIPEFWAHQVLSHPGAVTHNRSSPSHLRLLTPSHPSGLSLNAISLDSCSGNLI